MDAKSKTSKSKMTAAQRKEKAVIRRIGGWTFQAIGDELGITKQAAHKLVMSALKELNEKTMESTAEMKRLQREQLNTMTNALWGAVLKGDIGAITAMDRVQKRLAALEGLDQPQKMEVKTDIIEVTIGKNEG